MTQMVQFITEHRATYGVEPICAVLPIALSTYYWQCRQQAHSECRGRNSGARDGESRGARWCA